ncbi:MAG: hypothetical protein WBM86_30485 [Waterburya sp.]
MRIAATTDAVDAQSHRRIRWESPRFDDDMAADLSPLTARHNADKSLADGNGLRYTPLGDRVAFFF